jgi:hypothetical protein
MPTWSCLCSSLYYVLRALTNCTNTTMAPKKKKMVWRNSKAKVLLRKDFVEGELPLNDYEMTPKEVFESRPEYSATEWSKFPDRLRGLRRATVFRIEEAEDDEAALAHDRVLYPVSEFELDGNYKWHGSEAESFLKEDAAHIVSEGQRNDPGVTPLNLWLTRLEYQVFHPDKFSNHFYQAFKRFKFDTFVQQMKQEREKKQQEE